MPTPHACCSCCRIILPHLLPLFFISTAAGAAQRVLLPFGPPTAGFNISCYISLHAQIYCRVMGNAACYSENVCEIPLMPPVLLDFCEGLRDTFWCCWSDIGQNKVVSLFSLACSSAFIRLLLMASTELLWFIFRQGLFWVYCFEPHMPHMHAA